MNGCVAELERLLLTGKSQMRVTEPFRGNWARAETDIQAHGLDARNTHCSNAREINCIVSMGVRGWFPILFRVIYHGTRPR